MRLFRTIAAIVGWLLNTLVLIAILLLVTRAAVEFVPKLTTFVPLKKLVGWMDAYLQPAVTATGLPWSREMRGLGLPFTAFVLFVLRATVGDIVDRLIAALARARAPVVQQVPPVQPIPNPMGTSPGQVVRPVTSTSTHAGAPVAAPAAGVPVEEATVLAPAPRPTPTGTMILAASQKPTVIGRYQILEELGRGAMGCVYKGQDPKIGRTVAIKTITGVGLGDEEMDQYRIRFEQEARSAGRLNHPAIVGVYDVVDDEFGRPCLVLEFVRGTTLDKLAGKSRLPLAEILGYLVQIARALAYAHGNGIIHRDIKPANIMITEQGQAKLSDFGIAKIEGTTLTVAGQVLGTPAFMSPEQCMGSAVDARSDIFSFGSVLYTLLTGTKPFPGDTFTSVAYKVVHTEQLPLREVDPTLPTRLEAVVSRCLAKDPADRFQSAALLADELEAIRATVQQEAAIPPDPDPSEEESKEPKPVA